MKKLLIGLTAAVTIVAASLTFVAVNASGVSAQEGDTNTEDKTLTEWIGDVLDRLVDAGVIDDQQADDVQGFLPDLSRYRFRLPPLDRIPQDLDMDDLRRQFEEQFGDLEQLREQMRKHLDDMGIDEGDLEQLRDQMRERFGNLSPQDFRFGPRGPMGAMPFLGDLRDQLDGVTLDELRDAMENGTLDELIDLDALASDARAAAEERLADAVANGRISQEQADEILAHLDEKLDALRNGELPLRHLHFGRHGGPGWFGTPDADGAANQDAGYSA